jgi:uncharacterized protein (DUF983 family)
MLRNIQDGISSKESKSRGNATRTKFVKQKQKAKTLVAQLEIEIECPRCKETLELYSDFDRLYYYCESCCLHLLVG